MLIAPQEVIPECVEKIKEEYFYIPAHQTVFRVLVQQWSVGQAIDRFGSRIVLTLVTLALSAVVCAMSQTSSFAALAGVTSCALPRGKR